MTAEFLGNCIRDIVRFGNCREVTIQESSDSARHCLVIELERVADVDLGDDRERIRVVDGLSLPDPVYAEVVP